MLLEFVVIYDFIAYRKKDNVLLIVCIGAHNFLVCVSIYIYIYHVFFAIATMCLIKKIVTISTSQLVKSLTHDEDTGYDQ
jgi:hypothetical protein